MGEAGGCTVRRVDHVLDGSADVVAALSVEAAAARAFAADVVLVVASLGILLGPFADDLAGDASVGVVAAPVPALRMMEAPAVDLVTRVGRCSDAVIPRVVVAFDGFILFRAGGAASDGNASSSASSSES